MKATHNNVPPKEVCQKARLSRDPRFDGKFFTAVKTTGIYCRSICPVQPPKEQNVEYFANAMLAANAGFRPCLRCRPDSAPGSPAWKGVSTTIERCLRLLNNNALQDIDLAELAAKLGITDRYLRQIFRNHLGVSPKAYALYQQCLFAKQLLHQTNLPITEVALASGFNSIRRFNDCFVKQMQLPPSQVRKKQPSQNNGLHIQLYYRPPYDWQHMLAFLQARLIPSLEWVDGNSYGRTFRWQQGFGQFTVTNISAENRFDLEIELSDISCLKAVVNNIRRLLDIDADIATIEADLRASCQEYFPIKSGLRLPGIWDMFEAGIRAVLGQQISVTAAKNLVTKVVENLGEEMPECQQSGIQAVDDSSRVKRLFPRPAALAESEFAFLKMPGSRKQTLRNLAQHYVSEDNPDDPEAWLRLKGIGPWTTEYAQMRGLSDPDIYLAGDLGVKKAMLKAFNGANNSDNAKQLTTKSSDWEMKKFNPETASPWRSYLTFQLWSQL